jgi:hypothetical protein
MHDAARSERNFAGLRGSKPGLGYSARVRKLATLGSLLSGGLVALALACGDDPVAAAADAGVDAPPPSDTGPPNVSADTAPSPAPSGPCRADELCFDVTPLRPGTAPLPGRLMLLWFQLDDDGPDPGIKIGYQASFNGTDTRVVIPLSQVALPEEVHLLCERACDDEATCPCLSEPKAGIGLVAVYPDNDAAPGRESIGVAAMAVGYSDKEFKPSPLSFSGKFPDGIEQGVRGYKLVRPDGGGFDDLGFAPPGTVYQLPVCDTTDREVCRPRGPNLT